MANIPILFQSGEIARTVVAGIPAAARVVALLADQERIEPGAVQVVAVPGGWTPDAATSDEFVRLAPGLAIRTADSAQHRGDAHAIDGMLALTRNGVVDAEPLRTILARQSAETPQAASRRLDSLARAIVQGTGKPTDGLVSRLLNRPVSRFISTRLLRRSWVRPIHGTIAAGAIGIVMALCLLFGGEPGRIVGAFLFHFASIVDGVDGEIARATQRSSKGGASLDTATDAATNLAFIGGLCVNCALSGETTAALVGTGGLACLAAGLTLLGLLSLRAGGPLSFDLLKTDGRVEGSHALRALARVTSRDVYALVFALFVIAGASGAALALFGAATAIWLAFVIFMLAVRRPSFADS